LLAHAVDKDFVAVILAAGDFVEEDAAVAVVRGAWADGARQQEHEFLRRAKSANTDADGQRKIENLAAVDHPADVGGFRLQGRSIGVDGDGGGGRANLEGDVEHRGALNLDVDAGEHGLLKAAGGDGDVVTAEGQLREAIDAFGGGDGVGGGAGLLALSLNFGAGNYGARRIGYSTGHAAIDGLGECDRGEKSEACARRKQKSHCLGHRSHTASTKMGNGEQPVRRHSAKRPG
jgi:hypothetical protein